MCGFIAVLLSQALLTLCSQFTCVIVLGNSFSSQRFKFENIGTYVFSHRKELIMIVE